MPVFFARRFAWVFVLTILILAYTSAESLGQFRGHEKAVTCVAFHPKDTSRFASTSEDGTVVLWDRLNRKAQRTFKAHRSGVNSIALCSPLSSNDVWLATAGADNTLKLWELNSGKLIHTLAGHSAETMSVAFTLDASKIISGSRDKTIRIWNSKTGALLSTWKGHTGAVNSVCDHGKWVVSGSSDKTIKIWNRSTGNTVQTLKGHQGPVTCVCAVGDLLVSGSTDGAVKIWDLKKRKVKFTCRGHRKAVNSIDVSNVGITAGTHIASAGEDKTIKIWRVSTGKLESTIKQKTEIRTVAFNEVNGFAGSRLAWGGADGTVDAINPYLQVKSIPQMSPASA